MKEEINRFCGHAQEEYRKTGRSTQDNAAKGRSDRNLLFTTLATMNQNYQASQTSATAFLKAVQDKINTYSQAEGHIGGLKGRLFGTKDLTPEEFAKISKDPDHKYAYFLGKLKGMLEECVKLEQGIKLESTAGPSTAPSTSNVPH